jgi:hypothetical protein
MAVYVTPRMPTGTRPVVRMGSSASTIAKAVVPAAESAALSPMKDRLRRRFRLASAARCGMLHHFHATKKKPPVMGVTEGRRGPLLQRSTNQRKNL